MATEMMGEAKEIKAMVKAIMLELTMLTFEVEVMTCL
jgi:hypothetical protein